MSSSGVVLRVVMATVVASVSGATLQAQTCTTPASGSLSTRKCTVTMAGGSWVVEKVGTLTLSSTADIPIPSPDASTYDGIKSEAITLSRTATVSANAPWNLSVAPSSAAACSTGVCWTGADLAAYSPYLRAEQDKPADEFLVGTTYSATASGYVPLPDQNTPAGVVNLKSNQAAVSGGTVTLYWAEKWWYLYDLPGTYTLPFVVTLTIP